MFLCDALSPTYLFLLHNPLLSLSTNSECAIMWGYIEDTFGDLWVGYGMVVIATMCQTLPKCQALVTPVPPYLPHYSFRG